MLCLYVVCKFTWAHQAAGSYSAQILTYSSRWWGPRIEESRVRYSKLSMITATKRFNIYTHANQKSDELSCILHTKCTWGSIISLSLSNNNTMQSWESHVIKSGIDSFFFLIDIKLALTTVIKLPLSLICQCISGVIIVKLWPNFWFEKKKVHI